MKKILPFIFTLPLILTACGGDNSTSSGATQIEQAPEIGQASDKNLRMGMNLDLSKLQSTGVAADKSVVIITKGDFTQTIETAHIDYAASVEFTNLTIGEYSISVQIFDGETLVAEGLGLGAVSANQVAIVNMNLELKSGGLVVNINVPSPIEGEYETFSLEKMMVTTTDKLDRGPIRPSGILGGIVTGFFDKATYDHEAAYTQLEKDSEIKINFGISYKVTNTDDLAVVPKGLNTLEIKYNELTVISCTECDSDIQKNADTLTINYKNVALPEEVVASLVHIDTGEAIEIFPAVVLAQHLNVEITFTRKDGGDISEGSIVSEFLLDESEYHVQLELEGEACIDFPAEGCAGLGAVSAN